MDPYEIRREMSGGTGASVDAGERPSRKNRKPPKYPTRVERAKRPTAPVEASNLGQHWYDLGNRSGFEFPYDANYFALALHQKIEEDPEIRPFLDAGKRDQVDRWVRKMIEIWWNPGTDEASGYLTNEIKPRNAKEYFLNTDWEDVRDYARSSLRAAYLREHGKKVPSPAYPGQQDYQERLQAIRERAIVGNHLERAAEAEEPHIQVDSGARDRLRSWREKRRSK